jgi:hypothetical protein
MRRERVLGSHGMTSRSVEAIVQALNRAEARYLIVGGLAVVAHGHVRFTADMDLVLDPEPAGLRRAIEALGALGYRPRAPVALEEFLDAAKRRNWMKEKGLTVFSLFSSAHPATELDLFVEPPFEFDGAFRQAARFEVGPGVSATFVSRDQLIAMKRAAGRPQDLQDVARLEVLGKPGAKP